MVIYKIYCNDETIKDFYIGSSLNFDNRKRQHKYNCNNNKSNEYNIKLYHFIRNNGGWDNWSFMILKELELTTQNELRLKYERKFQLELKPTLNCKLEGRTKIEYKEENKEKYIEIKKKSYLKNKEKYKEHRQENKEYFKENMLKWRENNKEHIKEYKKNYNEEKFKCGCGGSYNKSHKSRHFATNKHLEWKSKII